MKFGSLFFQLPSGAVSAGYLGQEFKEIEIWKLSAYLCYLKSQD